MAQITTSGAEPWRRPQIVNTVFADKTSATVVYPVALSADRLTVYGTVGNKLRQSVDDGVTWADVFDAGAPLQGFWLMPNGEALRSTKPGGSTTPGSLQVSTGWGTNPATATWATVATASRGSAYVHPHWGLGMAPKGHVREGLVVATEYGPQTVAGDDPALMGKVWLSTDYGKTFRQIFHLAQVGSTGMHIHGCTYDPWDDAVYVSFGDGNGTTGAKAGVMRTTNFLATTPSWDYIVGPSTSADGQLTWIRPTADALLFGGDGTPPGLYRLGRRGFRVFASRLQTIVNFGGGTDTGFIGQCAWQNDPGSPLIMGLEYSKDVAGVPPTLIVTENGRDFAEAWNDVATYGVTATKYPLSQAVGPTARGKIVGLSKRYSAAVGSSLWSNFVADYIAGA